MATTPIWTQSEGVGRDLLQMKITFYAKIEEFITVL